MAAVFRKRVLTESMNLDTAETKPANIEEKTLSLKKIFKGASIYSAGGALVQASSFFLLPLYTRVLTPEDYGIVGYLQVFITLSTVVLGFGFYGAQTRYLYENTVGARMFGRFAFTINIVPLAVAMIIGLPIIITGSVLGWTLSSGQIPFYPYMVVVFGILICEVVSRNAGAFYRAQQKFTFSTMMQLVQFFFATLFTILFIVHFKLGALGRLGGMFCGLMVVLMFSLRGYIKQFEWKFSYSGLKFAAGWLADRNFDFLG